MKQKQIITLNYILLVTLISFSFLTSILKADDNENKKPTNIEGAKKLVDILKSTMTYQADFKQSVFRDDAVEPEVTMGRFLIHRPNHFKWHTKSSYEQVIIADGDHLWTYDPDLEQVTIQNQSVVLTNSPLLLLTSGVEELVKAYEIQEIKNIELVDSKTQPSDLLFSLKPKENSLFESIHILIKDKNIAELFLSDALGSKTSVVFTNVIRNEKIDVKEFIFETPNGTDVIDSRESL